MNDLSENEFGDSRWVDFEVGEVRERTRWVKGIGPLYSQLRTELSPRDPERSRNVWPLTRLTGHDPV